MRLGLRAGELAEDGERDVLRALRKAGCLDDGMDVRERAVSMVVTMLVAVLSAGRSRSSLTPRSRSAATVMSPLMPEDPSTMRAR